MQEFVLADRINNSDLIKIVGQINLDFLNQLIKKESLPITLFMPHRTSGAKYDVFETLMDKFLGNKDKYFGYLSIPKNVLTTDQFKGQDVSTAYNNEKINLKDSKTLVDINGTAADIIVPDMVCTNGVIHYVNTIMAYKGGTLPLK
ncbi:MAG: hypothetical protein K0R59_219 [Sphingobacterium sp.]|jgi:hypothetical protein|nr:hypothetical protein [Sphingobacterium sp.]